MAILNKIRQKTAVLILVIALALFAFILSSLFDNKDALFNKSPNVVATINGKDIMAAPFSQKVELQQQRMGANATQMQAVNAVYEQEVRAAVMDKQYETLGMTVQGDQMRELLKTNLASNPEFLNEAGLFDEAKLNTYIANRKETSPESYQAWLDFEKSLENNALQANYFNMVKAGSTATLAEGALEHKLQSEKVNIKYVQIPFKSIADSTIQVSESEIKTYMNNNKKMFEEDATRNIQYVFFKEEASAQDEQDFQDQLNKLLRVNEADAEASLITTKNIKAFVNEHSDNAQYSNAYAFKSSLPSTVADSIINLKDGAVYGPYKDAGYYKLTKLVERAKLPDSAKTRHILIPFLGLSNATADAKPEAEAKTFADSLLTVLKSNKSKFGQFVTDYSSDQGSKENGGKYDWFPYNRMVPEFRDFAFESKVGALGVVKTQFGFHIIEVEGQKGSVDAYKFATVDRKIVSSEETNDKIFRDASNFEITVSKNNFVESAKAINYAVNPVTGIKALDENIPGVGNQRSIIRWAFNEDTKVGDYKNFPVNGGFVIAEVTAVNEKGLKSIADASVTALPELKNKKKAELIKQRISATTIEDIASAEGQQVRTATDINMKNPTIAGAGNEPLVVGHAFGLADGETSGLIVGDSGVFMIQVTKKTPAIELDNYQSFANQVGTEKLNAVQSKLYNALKEAADIEDNRSVQY